MNIKRGIPQSILWIFSGVFQLIVPRMEASLLIQRQQHPQLSFRLRPGLRPNLILMRVRKAVQTASRTFVVCTTVIPSGRSSQGKAGTIPIFFIKLRSFSVIYYSVMSFCSTNWKASGCSGRRAHILFILFIAIYNKYFYFYIYFIIPM